MNEINEKRSRMSLLAIVLIGSIIIFTATACGSGSKTEKGNIPDTIEASRAAEEVTDALTQEPVTTEAPSATEAPDPEATDIPEPTEAAPVDTETSPEVTLEVTEAPSDITDIELPEYEPDPETGIVQVTTWTGSQVMQPVLPIAPGAAVDVDISSIPDNLLFTQMYGILNNSDAYIGQTFRVKGYYIKMQDEDVNGFYHICCAFDDDGCMEGFEFVLVNVSEGYPEEGTPICVTGTLDTYIAPDGELYCTLRSARFETIPDD